MKHFRVALVRNVAEHDFGGAERFVVFLATEIDKAGFSAIVLSRHKQLKAFAKSSAVRCYTSPWLSSQNFSGHKVVLFPVYLLWQFVLFFYYAATFLWFRVDAVHLQSRDDFIAGTLASKLFRRRVIWTDHADLKHIYANNRVWYKNPVGKLVYACSKLANHVTLVSNSEARLVSESLGHHMPKNYQVIHNGAEDRSVIPAKRDKADERAVVFCSTSRLVGYKGISELVGAFQKFSPKTNVRLWLVGDGPDQATFEAQAGGDKRIIFWGHQDQPLQFLAAADVFVHPTHHEGFSLSIVEATMLGKPLIVTDVGGNPEIADETNAILVATKSVQELFEAMQRLQGDESLRRKLAHGARQKFEQGFDFHKIVKERFVPLYEK